jgi:hypothetical protein
MLIYSRESIDTGVNDEEMRRKATAVISDKDSEGVNRRVPGRRLTITLCLPVSSEYMIIFTTAVQLQLASKGVTNSPSPN